MCLSCGVYIFSHTRFACVCIACVCMCVGERGSHVGVMHACVSVGLCESVRVCFVVYTYMFCDVYMMSPLHMTCVSIASVFVSVREKIACVCINTHVCVLHAYVSVSLCERVCVCVVVYRYIPLLSLSLPHSNQESYPHTPRLPTRLFSLSRSYSHTHTHTNIYRT